MVNKDGDACGGANRDGCGAAGVVIGWCRLMMMVMMSVGDAYNDEGRWLL